MPNGLTAGIYEGKDVSLRDYLMGVGRQMGFAVLQRDEPLSDPVRTAEPYRTYYDKQEADARQRMAYLAKLKPEHIAAEAHAEYREAFDKWSESRAKTIDLRNRYEGMLIEVMAWRPDALVAFTKEHAERYLREAIEFDCGHVDSWRPVEREPDVWYREEMAAALKSLERAQTGRDEELERTTDRNRHIEAFLRSLPTPPTPDICAVAS